MKKFLLLIPVLAACKEPENRAALMVIGQVPAAACVHYSTKDPTYPDVAICALPEGGKVIATYGGQIPFKAFPIVDPPKKDGPAPTAPATPEAPPADAGVKK